MSKMKKEEFKTANEIVSENTAKEVEIPKSVKLTKCRACNVEGKHEQVSENGRKWMKCPKCGYMHEV